MKKRFIIASMAAVIALVSSLVSCNQGGNSGDTAVLSVNPVEVVFNADGTATTPTITVATNQAEWSYSMSPADGNGWLTAVKTGNELQLTATVNTETTAPASVTISFTAGQAQPKTVTVSQRAVGDVIVEQAYRYELPIAGIPLSTISENGRYLAGYNSDAGIVFDVTKLKEDGTIEEGYEAAAYLPGENPDLEVIENTFLLQGVDNSGNPYPMIVTADGSIMVGYTGRSSTGWTPNISVNGEIQVLPLPDDYLGLGSDYRGAMADYISADGNVIIGRMRTYTPFVSVYWKKNAGGQYEWHQIAEDHLETVQDGPYINLVKWPASQPASGASYNGKYAFGAIMENTFNTGPRYPFIFDIETGVTTLVPGQDNANATAVTDDGILFFATPFTGLARIPYVFENGVTKTFAEWVLENYGLEIENAGTVQAISRDKKVVLWTTYGMEGFVNNIIVVK